jgi:hypothetical protein
MTERTRSDLQNMVHKSRTFDNVTAVAILGLGVAFVGFTLNRQADSALPTTLSVIAKRAVGRELKLPEVDSFGRKIVNHQNRTLVVLAGCNSCSISMDSKVKNPHVQPGDVLITADGSQKSSMSAVRNPVILDLGEKKLIPGEL